MLINPYTPDIILRNFPNLNTAIDHYYDIVYDTIPNEAFDLMTPRYRLEHGLKIGFRDIFYYIDLLYDNNPESVIDVGCGECIWKNWFPNIIGFDPVPSEWSKADFVDFFDETFSLGHKKNYTCGMALNSIHFIDWDYLPTQIRLAMDIVQDKFLFTFNFNVIQHKPSEDFSELFLIFVNILKTMEYDIVLLDCPRQRGFPVDIHVDKSKQWSHINGTVRVILAHKEK